VFAECVEIPYRAIKSNIADSLNVIIQIERRPGQRFVSDVVEIRDYDAETDSYDLHWSFVGEKSEESALGDPVSENGKKSRVT